MAIDDEYENDEMSTSADDCSVTNHCRCYRGGRARCCDCGEPPAGYYPLRPTYDELLAERDSLLTQRAALATAVMKMWDLIGTVANECESSQDEDGNSLTPDDETLDAWGGACKQACVVAHTAVSAHKIGG